MGEQGSFSPPNHIVSVIMRNSRGKLFVYIALLSVLCFIVFLLSSTHTRLKELEGVNEKCQQQRDSSSAQLQVVYEHKNRLEKSLQQEKTDHRHTNEVKEKQLSELEIKLQQEKDKIQQLENQITQLKTSYSELEEDKTQAEHALKEQLQSVQNQKNADMEKLQKQLNDILSEKDKLELANTAFAWKIEQHTSAVSLCQLQLQQSKGELSTCQEQLQKCFQNTVDIPSPVVPSKATDVKLVPNIGNENYPAGHENKIEDREVDDNNKTHGLLHSKDKNNVLEKPHIMPANNAIDGVLPKPLEEKQDSNKGQDAALEDNNSQRKDIKNNDQQISNNIDEKGLVKQEHLKDGETREQPLKLYPLPLLYNNIHAADKAQVREQENHPQVQPPNNFDNAGDKDDHAGERGEFGNGFPQYAGHDVKQQVEQPVFHDFSNKFYERRKNLVPIPRQANNDIAAGQMQDMMNKSPGNVNNPGEQNVLNAPHEFGAIDNKINQFRNGPFLNGRADGHRAIDEKHYEEDDDDRENDDEPINGAGQGMKGNLFQDNDFDDQDNQDNMDNAKEEEGVVVAPK